MTTEVEVELIKTSYNLDVEFTVMIDPYSNAMRECAHCEQEFAHEFDNPNFYHTENREYYRDPQLTHYYFCSDCVMYCDDCGDARPPHVSNTGTVRWGEWLVSTYCTGCSDSYTVCLRCDDVLYNDDVCRVASDSDYCRDCVEYVASWCNECDQWEWTEDLCSPHDDNIHNYGYKPNPAFHGQSDNFMYFGFELEVEAKRADLSDGAQLVVDTWDDFVYLKEDGSLDFGFEMVTHPATLDYLHNHVDWTVLTKLRDMGFRSWDAGTCGLHVHIDRRAFKDRTHLLAMTYLINNNESLTRHIAGRNSDYGRIGNGCKMDNFHTLKYYGRGRGGERYLAINLQNTSTVELRMFKGSLKVERVLSGLEYAHAVVEYSRGIRNGLHAKEMLKPEEFMSWIRKQGKYPNLVSYLPEVTINANEMEE